MNSNLVEAALSVVTGLLIVFSWIAAAYILEELKFEDSAHAMESEPMVAEEAEAGDPNTLKIKMGDIEVLTVEYSSEEDAVQFEIQELMQSREVEPAPSRPETIEMVNQADALMDEVYEMHTNIGVLTNEIK